MVSNLSDGPDFICIGMPKAGTGWLFDQLKYHPDFWVPPVKEMAYLSRGIPRLKSAQKRLDTVVGSGKTEKFSGWANRRPGDKRDFDFLREVNGSIGEEMNLGFYASLFRYKEKALSGDVSSGYCMMDPETISRLQEALPLTKILLLARDPVARAQSHISMWHRSGTFKEELLTDGDAFRNFLENSGKLRRTSFPSQIVARWRQKAPKLSFRYFFFDDIAQDAQTARKEILLYLGADPEKASGDLAAGHNKKAKGRKLMFDNRAKAVLVDHFRDELRACADLFGERGKSWAALYGL